MKKLVLSLAILAFVAFGAIAIQNLIASPSQVEVVNFDKDPKKEETKKAADTKEVSADSKTTKATDQDCSSSCSDKSASSKSCCGHASDCCSPDKK